jgi:hypothetical protein
MIDQLEIDLQEALAHRAAEVPSDLAIRLRQLDYHPRAYRVRPPIAAGAVAGTAGAAAAVISIASLGAGASNAFAGWAPAPTPASNAQVAKAQATCRARLASAPMPPGPKIATPADAKPVLTDTRGPFTVVIFAGQDATQSCIDGPSFTSLSGSSGAGTNVPAGRIQLTGVHFTTRDGHPYAIVEGHAGPGVKETTLVLSDHTRIKASTANGWFTAWWPGSQDVTAADLATATGVTTQHFTTHGRIDCGPGPCTRGAGPGHGAGISGTISTGGERSGSGPRGFSLSKP